MHDPSTTKFLIGSVLRAQWVFNGWGMTVGRACSGSSCCVCIPSCLPTTAHDVVAWCWCSLLVQGEKIKRTANARHAPLGQQILEGDAPKQRSRVMKVKKTTGEGDDVSARARWWSAWSREETHLQPSPPQTPHTPSDYLGVDPRGYRQCNR